MSERLQGIATFVATVEAASFSAAGERLQLSRSAVGKAIARLETRLGVRLFHRTTRSQRLTEDGQLYYERCRRALAELDEASVSLEAGRREPVGRLRLSMPELLGRRCVAPLLLELGREHVGLSLDVSFTDRRVDLLEERIDLALRSGPMQRRATWQHIRIRATSATWWHNAPSTATSPTRATATSNLGYSMTRTATLSPLT